MQASGQIMRRILAAHTLPLLLWCVALFSSGVKAAEVDQFTLPDGEPTQLADSTMALDGEVNRRILLAIKRANGRVMKSNPRTGVKWYRPGCDEERLYEKLVDQLARTLIGQVESYAEQNEQVSRRTVPLQQSIYRDFAWQTAPSLVISERIASVIRLDSVELGTDKLGHFFSEGFSYFAVTGQLNKSLKSGLLFGEWSESVYFGAQTTGVFSYADLTANFQGLRFWNRILAKHPDPLTGKMPSPYVVCKRDEWRLAQSFHWYDYVDNGWDESINCPLLNSEALLETIQQQDLHCRTDKLPLERYGKWAHRLLNRQGHAVVPEHLQPENILQKRVASNDVDVSENTLRYISKLRERLENWRRESILAAEAVSD